MVRIIFSKTGYARYISHLDTARTMQRAIKRAGLPIWYTEGFNPHPYMNFCAPLSVGIEGNNEILDIKTVVEMPFEEMSEKLKKAFPQGFDIVEIYNAETSLNNVSYAEYLIKIGKEAKNNLVKFIAQEEISVIKKTKRSEEKINLKDEMTLSEIEEIEDFSIIKLILPCGNQRSVNPILFIKAFEEFHCKEFSYYIQRNQFFDNNMIIFK